MNSKVSLAPHGFALPGLNFDKQRSRNSNSYEPGKDRPNKERRIEVGEVMDIDIKDLYPGQLRIGKTAAEAKLDGWRKEAIAWHLDFRDYANVELRKNFSQRPLPVFVDPRGKVRLADGHHKIWALRHLLSKIDLDFLISVKFEGNFRGLVESDYSCALSNIFPIADVDRENRALHVAQSFEDMVDCPLRSIVGMSLKKLGISSKWLVPMAQFKIGKTLLDSSLVPKGELGFASLSILNKVATIFSVDWKIRSLILSLAASRHCRSKILSRLLPQMQKVQAPVTLPCAQMSS